MPKIRQPCDIDVMLTCRSSLLRLNIKIEEKSDFNFLTEIPKSVWKICHYVDKSQFLLGPEDGRVRIF